MNAADEIRRMLELHGAALTLYARQWCRQPEDALQEALIALLQQEPRPQQPAAWLFHVVRRKAMNLARSEQRRSRIHAAAAQTQEPWFDASQPTAVRRDDLQAMLQALPALEREIVVARIWGELTFPQIAQLVGKSTSNVHRRYQRALALLQKSMPSLDQPARCDHASRPLPC